MSIFQSLKFKKLRKKWYDKLKRQGFRDIENSTGDLTVRHSPEDFGLRVGFRAGIMEEIQAYYIWAEQMIRLGRFKCTADRKIWALHAIGKSSREIAIDVPLDQSMICRKIKKIRAYLQLQTREEEREYKRRKRAA